MDEMACAGCGGRVTVGVRLRPGDRVWCPACRPAAGPPPRTAVRPPPLRRNPRPTASPNPVYWIVGAVLGGGVLLLACVLMLTADRVPVAPPPDVVAAPKPEPVKPPPLPPVPVPVPKKEFPPPAPQKPDPPAGAPAAPPADVGNEVYRKMLTFTVLVIQIDGEKFGFGSGAVVDRDQKLVVTNYHVVPDTANRRSRVIVMVPEFDPSGTVIMDPQTYLQRLRKPQPAAVVLHRDAGKDLAVIQVKELPERMRAVELARRPAEPGETVYSLGNSGLRPGGGGAGYLWRYTDGRVRGRLRPRVPLGNGQVYDAWTLETSAPVNPGDSGGPVVNGRGELVGVVSSYEKDAREVSNNVCVTEVRELLAKLAPDR